MATSKRLILFDHPTTGFSKTKTFFKVLIKEGLLHGSWHSLFHYRHLGGSIVIPNNLIQGFNEINAEFSTSFSLRSKYDVAFVLKNTHALQWAIQAKKRGLIKKLVAGPFISNFPRENKKILLSKEIDGLLFLCDWHRNLFLDHCPAVRVRDYIWFSGLDTTFWMPLIEEKRYALIYIKRPIPTVFQFVVSSLEERKIPYKVLTYGNYTPQEYKSLLNGARFTIFISPSETQGLNMFESWSMNVPSLHWEQHRLDYFGTSFEKASSCPYLSPRCGQTFENREQFQELLVLMENNYLNYTPRSYVLDHFTLRHSAKRMIQIGEDVLDERKGESERDELRHYAPFELSSTELQI